MAGAADVVKVKLEENGGGGKRAPSGPRHWTCEEDDLLRAAVEAHGPRQWKEIAKLVPTRSHTQCLQRWNKVLKPGLLKGPWSAAEDYLLRALVEQSIAGLPGAGAEDAEEDPNKRVDWTLIAENIAGRSVKQCRERWCSNLDPRIKKGAWSAEEDRVLLETQASGGNCWAQIARMLPGRTEHAVKTRFRSIMRARRREWTREEDELLLAQYQKHGSQWNEVAKPFIGSRTRNAVMKRFKQLRSDGSESAESSGASTASEASLPSATGRRGRAAMAGGDGDSQRAGKRRAVANDNQSGPQMEQQQQQQQQQQEVESEACKSPLLLGESSFLSQPNIQNAVNMLISPQGESTGLPGSLSGMLQLQLGTASPPVFPSASAAAVAAASAAMSPLPAMPQVAVPPLDGSNGRRASLTEGTAPATPELLPAGMDQDVLLEARRRLLKRYSDSWGGEVGDGLLNLLDLDAPEHGGAKKRISPTVPQLQQLQLQQQQQQQPMANKVVTAHE